MAHINYPDSHHLQGGLEIIDFATQISPLLYLFIVATNLAIFAKMLVTFLSENLVTLTVFTH